MRTALLALFVSMLLVGRADAVKVRVVVAVPKDTDAVWLAGSLEQVGAWRAEGVKLAKLPDDRWDVTLDLPATARLEFKFNRGSWETVEKDAAGNEVPNRSIDVGPTDRVVELTVARWANAAAAAAKPSTVVGTLRLHDAFESKILGNARTIRVWLPPGYDADAVRQYPVFYLHDGQNLFDAATSAFGHELELDETATKLIEQKKIEPVILVGIDNVGAGRIDEYTPVRRTADDKPQGGNGEAYERFVVEELKPFIDRTYRTKAGRDDTAVGGASLGGLISYDMGRRYSTVFGKIAVVSPSLWWADEWTIAQDVAPLATTRVWLDMGTREAGDDPDSMAYVSQARALAKKLKGAKINVEYFEAVDAAHNEQAWAARADRVLMFLFPRQ